MATIGIRELKAHTMDILRQVQEQGHAIDITYRGEIIARIVPVQRTEQQREQTLAAWTDLKQLAAEIGARNLPPIDTSTLMQQERE